MGRNDGPSSRRGVDNSVHDLIAVSNDLRRHLIGQLGRLGFDDLRPGLAPLLSRVWEGAVAQRRLADELGLTGQAASQAVGLAERAGYVRRDPNPEDGRSKLVAITELGRKFVTDGAAAITERAAEYARAIGDARLGRFDADLVRLHAGLELSTADAVILRIVPRSAVGTVILLAEQATRRLHEALDAGGHGEVSGSQAAVLINLGPEGRRATDVARLRGVTRQAISSTMRDVESMGYLTRRDDLDGRGVVFVPTERGAHLVAAYVAEIGAIEQRYEAVLGRASYGRFAATAHELRHWIGIEQTLDSATALRPGATRTDTELQELAADLHAWLGDGDAVRLGDLVAELALERSRGRRRGAREAS